MYYAVMDEPIPQQIQRCMSECQECHAICLETASYCLSLGGGRVSAKQVTALLRCAETCQTSINFMVVTSPLQRHVCGVCAEACERCARDFTQLAQGDTQMETCADACRRCAEACQNVAAIGTQVEV